jgi:hypothetical protein
MSSMRRRSLGQRPRALLAATVALLAAALAVAPSALAEGGSTPYIKLDARAAPSNLPLKEKGLIIIKATNLGAEAANGTPKTITVADELPEGVKPVTARGRILPDLLKESGPVTCSIAAQRVTCTYSAKMPPASLLLIRIEVETSFTGPSEPVNLVTAEGGGIAAPVKRQQTLKVNGQPTGFGVESLELAPENEDGTPAEKAGSHPYQLTTTFDLNENVGVNEASATEKVPTEAGLQKDLLFKLPAGLIGNANVVGNPNAVQQCSDADFGSRAEGGANRCAPNTAVGVATVTINGPEITNGYLTFSVPVFNLVPAPGEPAKLGFEVAHVPVVLDTSVRTGEDYGVNITVKKTSNAVQVLGAQVTVWGVPGDARHDAVRGWGCLASFKEESKSTCGHFGSEHPSPFLLLPGSCKAPMTMQVSGDSWTGGTLSAEYKSPAPMKECDKLPFTPSIDVKPDESHASTPTGMTVEVNLPQDTTLAAGGLAEGTIEATKLALPLGMQANAGAANGLEVCPASQLGYNETTNGGFKEGRPEEEQTFNDDFSPTLPELTLEPCQPAAKIGDVEVNTPLLPHPLTGWAYLAAENTNPFKPGATEEESEARPLVLYLVAKEEPKLGEGSKVAVKLAGEIRLDYRTGQLVSVFKNTPQTPFSRLKLHLFNGGRASQATPATCGAYAANAEFTPWTGGTPVPASSNPESFQITAGPGGGPCPTGALPFGPATEAGSMNLQAGAFTSFSLTINRGDGSQALKSIDLHLPKGLAAMLSSVTPCPSTQATCGPESHIGHSTALAGLGPTPVALGGDVYLTGPYKGAPFGILSVTHATAGPFHLGDILVRSTINVDPITAAATITSDEIPAIVKGAPSQIKQLNVTVDREGFQFNPTNCDQLAITGSLAGYEGGSAPINQPFRVNNCASLPFKPTFEAFTEKDFSKANGASLTVRVKSSPGQANIGKTKVVIPMELPSRLTTIQQACPDQVFAKNPATCPEGSVIGSATAHTPVLKNPVTGPAYLVSHAAAAFPDVEFLLQGEGITLLLDGETFIHNGVTTSTFNALPDAPVTTFETVLPKGPHSALAAVPSNGAKDLCSTKLFLPTTMTGQNGIVVQQNTPVHVTGCKGVAGLTNRQLLAKALAKCRKQFKHNTRKRHACEAAANKRFGGKKASSKHHKSTKKH